MNGLFESEKTKPWLREKLPQLTRGGGIALCSIFLLCGLMLGSMIGYSSGKENGYASGYSAGKQDGFNSGYYEGLDVGTQRCPVEAWWNDTWVGTHVQVESTEPETMNFSAFLDWAGKVELPPIGWALLILLALVIIK